MVLRLTSPETGHRLAVKAAHYGLMPRVKTVTHPELVLIVLMTRMFKLFTRYDSHVSFSALTLWLGDKKDLLSSATYPQCFSSSKNEGRKPRSNQVISIELENSHEIA